MKKNRIIAFYLAIIMLVSSAIPVFAADGGFESLKIVSPSDNGTVRGDKAVTISWLPVLFCHHYHVTIKDMVTGEKFEYETTSTFLRIEANTAFKVAQRQYKIYVAAMNSSDQVMTGGSEWHAVYCRCEMASLTYTTPQLTTPNVPLEYHPETPCYVGIYDDGIPTDENLTLKWENVYADEYVVSIIILEGEPNIGSTSESREEEIIIKKKTSRRQYTIQKEELLGYEGKYIKVCIQAMNNEGDYSLMNMSYLRLGTTQHADDENDKITEDKITENIIINGINIGCYSVGDYFTKNGKACSCHNSNICLKDETKCNCLRYINYNGETVDLASVQCFGFSRYIQLCLYGKSDIESEAFSKLFVNRSDFTAKELRDTLISCLPGTHIRTSNSAKGYAHSISLITADTKGVTISDCNHSGRCQIDLRSYTWDEFTKWLNSYGGVDYISVFNNQETPVGNISIAFDDVTATPGSTVEVPIRVASNTGMACLQLKIETDLAFSLTNGEVLPNMLSEEGGALWYAYGDITSTGVLATLEVQIPNEAKAGSTYNITAVIEEALTIDEDAVAVTVEPGGIITVKEKILKGDANGDGVLSLSDVLRVAKYLVSKDKSSIELDFECADINSDGKLSITDLINIIKLIFK